MHFHEAAPPNHWQEHTHAGVGIPALPATFPVGIFSSLSGSIGFFGSPSFQFRNIYAAHSGTSLMAIIAVI